MFKKRNTNKKATDLGQEVDQITHVEPQQQMKMDNQIRNEAKKEKAKARHQVKFGVKNMEDFEKEIWAKEQPDGGKIRSSIYQEEEKSERQTHQKQLEECFKEFKQLNKAEIEEDRKIKNRNIAELEGNMENIEEGEHEMMPQKFKNIQNRPNLQEDFDPFAEKNMQVEQKMNEYKPLVRMTNQMIIQNDSGDIIEVQEDYGQISPEENSQDNQQGYENEIIRKTLTHQNYLKINQDLSKAHEQSKRNKLLKQLGKISQSSVQRKIARDLRVKKSKKEEIKNEIKYIDTKIEKRMKEIKGKIETKVSLQAEFDKVRRILECIYYFGDEIQMLDQNHLIQMSQSDEYMGKISRLRENMRKNRQKFKRERNIDVDCKSEDEGKCTKKEDKWNGFAIDLDEGEGEGEDQDEVIVIN